EAIGDKAAVTINWGTFVNTIITFVVIAFVVFMIGKTMIKEAPAAAPTPVKNCPYCKQDNAVDASKCMHCASSI
ncbi:MAG: MscL family protein, partial [Chloroflexota bacterium]